MSLTRFVCADQYLLIYRTKSIKMTYVLKLILAVFVISNASCCNLTAFSSVNVVAHYNKFTEGQIRDGVNLNSLDGYVKLDVTSANVSVLCKGILRSFPVLETLSIINANISKVEPHAFQKIPKLTQLSLTANKLTTVLNGDFNYLKSLQVLYLSKNEITTVQDMAFNEMTNLKKVYLDRNKITSFSGTWFENCISLKMVDLSHNEITTIPERAFRNIPSNKHNKVQFKLGYNKIDIINPLVFLDSDEKRPSLALHLEGNNLEWIEDSVFVKFMKARSLILNNNNFECLSETILGEVYETNNFTLELLNNPISCRCVDRFNHFLNGNPYFADQNVVFKYKTNLDCTFPS